MLPLAPSIGSASKNRKWFPSLSKNKGNKISYLSKLKLTVGRYSSAVIKSSVLKILEPQLFVKQYEKVNKVG